MNSAISSLRILPAEADAAPFGSTASSELGSSELGSSELGSSEPGFRDVLGSAIDDIHQLESQAETKVAGVLSGDGTDVHSALIAVEKADLSFQLMMQVRNKIVSAYEEISRMQF
jgi:flagellar hook-basal body complex protein FliE